MSGEVSRENAASLYRPVNIGGVRIDGNLFLAPLAGFSDSAFRFVCIEGGANFCFSEMISAEGLVRASRKSAMLMMAAENEAKFAVQIFGSDPDIMAAAVKVVLEKSDASVIDINAGCPVKKVTKTGAGAALTRDFARLGEIVAACVKSSEEFCAEHGRDLVPITVKIRSGWGERPTFLEAAAAAVDAGAAAVTLHSRSCAQGYAGSANWSHLAKLADAFRGKCAVFGSGDVFTADDGARMLRETGCDATMFARGALGNPFVFRQTRDLLESGAMCRMSSGQLISAAMKELNLLIAAKGEKLACLEMRKRFCHYAKGMEGASSLRSMICTANTLADYRALAESVK